MRSYNRGHKTIFLFYGDLIRSHGTATYLASFLKYAGSIWKSVDTFFFQVYLPHVGPVPMRSGLPDLSQAPLKNLFIVVPRGIWRFYEMLWCYGKMILLLLKRKRTSGTTLFICGGPLLPLIYLAKALGYQTVYVKMGIIDEFLCMKHRNTILKYKLIHAFERHFLRKFDAITIVSEGMGEYIKERYAVSAERLIVLPCAVDQAVFIYRPDSRLEIRQDLDLQDRLVFVYCGIWAPWQCIPETIDCFRLIKEIDENAFFLILSPDRDFFQNALSVLNVQDYRILHVDHPLIDRYLSSADCGFLIRKRSRINRVASPLKFSEYLICGLPIIIGPEVGDFSAMVQNLGIGVVVDPAKPEDWRKRLPDFIKQISTQKEKVRKTCFRVAIEHYSWQSIAHRLEKLPRQIPAYL
jgi:glycosyltransferase involved in cell wall biosynthesis